MKRILMNALCAAALLSVLVACKKDKKNTPTPPTPTGNPLEVGEITDERDGKKYKTVKIGHKIWLSQEIDYYYDRGNGTFASTYYTIREAKGVCPKGFHLPTDREWQDLEFIAGVPAADTNQYNWRGGISAGDALLTGGRTGLNLIWNQDYLSSHDNYNPRDTDEPYRHYGIYRRVINVTETTNTGILRDLTAYPNLFGCVRCVND